MNLQYTLLVRIPNAWELALSMLLFAWVFPRRKYFWLRLFGGLGMYTLLAAATALFSSGPMDSGCAC